MSVDTTGAGAEAPHQPDPEIVERPATVLPGLPLAIVGLAISVLGIGLFVDGLTEPESGLVTVGAILVIIALSVFTGLTQVAPGEARVVQLFGRYVGTIRSEGLLWVNPYAKRRKISTRIRNHETTPAKVNDADGNPIEIAAVVVWQVEDTAKAVFGVENVTEFVAVQAEAAVRQIANDYPYEDHEGGVSLRGCTPLLSGKSGDADHSDLAV